MRYFDAHCHVQFDPYSADRTQLLSSMREAGIGGLVVGVDLQSSVEALALVSQEPNLFAAAGLHPNYVLKNEFDVRSFADLLRHPKVVAVGECGLDNYRPEDVEAAQGLQREVFTKHVELAIESDKPLMVHARPRKGTQDAYRDLIDILRSYKQEHGDMLRGDIHFFVGGIEEARDILSLGFTLSFTAVLTFARDYDDVVRFAPLTSILTETDAPYVAPKRIRGARNDPRSVQDVVEAIAGIRGEETEVVRATTVQNAQRLFTLPT